MTFLPQHTLIWTQSKASSVVKQGVGAHTPVHIFSLFSILLYHKLLSLQVALKQICAWEGKQDSEIPSKAFRLRGVSERGEWRCKFRGSRSTFALMLCRADHVCGEYCHLLTSLWQDLTLYLRFIFPPSAWQGGFVWFFFPSPTQLRLFKIQDLWWNQICLRYTLIMAGLWGWSSHWNFFLAKLEVTFVSSCSLGHSQA